MLSCEVQPEEADTGGILLPKAGISPALVEVSVAKGLD